MSDRETEIGRFLASAEMDDWQASPLSGDASSRRYTRLTSPRKHTALLMDWPTESDGDTETFVRIGSRIRQAGLSAPDIIAQDHSKGLLLLEDLGDDLFTEVLCTMPERTEDLYRAAVDHLIKLQRIPADDLEPLDPHTLSTMTRLAFDEYRRAIAGDDGATVRIHFEAKFEQILHHSVQGEMVFVHRDFHAQNLLWLPMRDGVAKVGVIDFQDAKQGHPAYDLVSLLQDARRDVSPHTEQAMIDYYIASTGCDSEAFQRAYAVLGVQRNMRILGIFARLAKAHAKPHYIDLIPRVWSHFTRGLEHSTLAPVARDLRAALPAPDAQALSRLRA